MRTCAMSCFWTWFFFFVGGGLVVLRLAEGSSNARAVYQVRQGENMTIPCWSTWYSRYKDARYTWLDHLERGAARNDMILHGDGSMEITDAQLSDTDTYKCVINLAGSATENHTRTVVVYMIAEYHMSYPFIYYVSECNYQLNNFKLHELHEFVCRDYETNCPFQAVTTCHKFQSSLSREERSQLVVFIQQHPLTVYRPPSCDVLCIKKSIVEHFDLMGSYIIRELYHMEQNSQRKIYGSIVFSRDASAQLADVKARCQSGYELYQDILCMPCYPGHYLKNSYSTEDELIPHKSRTHERCQPCPSDQFQDSFGMDVCFYCPKETYTSSNGTVSQELCKKKGFAISWTLMILIGLFVCFLATICCTWFIMGCLAGRYWWKVEKTADEPESEYPPLNEQQPWIELLRQCEESQALASESTVPVSQSPLPGEAPSLRPALKQRSFIDETPVDEVHEIFEKPVDVYPSTPATHARYSPIQPLPGTPLPGPPTPVPPVQVAVATPSLLERPSVASIRPALRRVYRHPAPLTTKPSDTNIYRQALLSGLREVRIMPPGSNHTSTVNMSRSASAESNFPGQLENARFVNAQHSEGVHPRPGPSSGSLGTNQMTTPVQYALLTPIEPRSTPPGQFRAPAGVLMPEPPLTSYQTQNELGQRLQAPPAEIEVEFVRVPSAGHRHSVSPHPGLHPGMIHQQQSPQSGMQPETFGQQLGMQPQTFGQQLGMQPQAFHQQFGMHPQIYGQPSRMQPQPFGQPSRMQPQTFDPQSGMQPQTFDPQVEMNAQSQDLNSSQQQDMHPGVAHRYHADHPETGRQRISHLAGMTPQPSAMMPQSHNLPSGTEPQVTGTESATEFQPQSRQSTTTGRPQRISTQPGMTPQPYGKSSLAWPQSQQQMGDMEVQQTGTGSYHPRYQSSGSNQSSEADQKMHLSIVKGRHSEPQTPSQPSSEAGQHPSQQSSETEQKTVSQQSSEIGRYIASQQSSETDHQHLATAQQPLQLPQSGPEAASPGQPPRQMRKALLDAINARSAPANEDTNVYD